MTVERHDPRQADRHGPGHAIVKLRRRRANGRRRPPPLTAPRTAPSYYAAQRTTVMIVTISLPAISGRFATFSVAASAAPEEMPPGMPSTRASQSSLRETVPRSSHWTISSIALVSARHLRHEAGADALDRMRRRLAAGQHRACLRFDRDHPQPGPARFQRLRGSRSACRRCRCRRRWRPPCPRYRRTGISSAVGSAHMDRRIRRIGDPLVGHQRARRRRQQLVRLRHRAVHALLARRQHQFGTEIRQHLAPLDRHALRHRHDKFVAARGAHERQPDARVARGRFGSACRPAPVCRLPPAPGSRCSPRCGPSRWRSD